MSVGRSHTGQLPAGTTIVLVVHPGVVTVSVRFTPVGIPVTVPAGAFNIPWLACTVVPAATMKLTLYVPAPFVSHTGPLMLTGEFAHGTPQLVGAVTFTLDMQLPLVAVTVIFCPNGILMILLPLTVPNVVLTIPISVLKDTLHVDVPHKGCPTVSFGYAHPPVPGQLAGLTTVRL